MTKKKKIIIQKIVFFALAAAGGILISLLLRDLQIVIYWALVAGSFALAAGVLFINANRFTAVYKMIITAISLLFAYAIVHIILQYSGVLALIDTEEELKALMESAGAWGIIVFFFLTLLQVIILPVPAMVTVVAGTYLFGAHVSFIVSTAGTIIGSIICFFIGRRFGKKVVVWIAGEEKTEKYAALIAEKGKIPFIAMLLFPFFPDDLLCLTAGLTKMSFKFFITAVVLARPVMLAYYSYFGGDDFLQWDAVGITLRIVIFAALLAAMFLIKFVYDRVMKKRRAKKSAESALRAEGLQPAFESAEDEDTEALSSKPRKGK